MVKTATNQTRNSSLLRLAVFIAILSALPFLFQRAFFRLDLTTEKRYTLSPHTKLILEELKTPVHIELYLDGSMPPAFKRLKLESREMLEELRSWSGGMLDITYTDPSGDDDAAKNEARISLLMKRGLQPLNLQVASAKGSSEHLIFPAAWVSSSRRSQGVSLMQNQNQYGSSEAGEQLINHSVETLEYTFINAIEKVSLTSPPGIGFLSSNGEASGAVVADLVHTLKESYRTYNIDLNALSVAELLKIKVLILIKPVLKFTETEKYKLDQYVMNGGKLVLSIDNLHAELDSMGRGTSTLAYSRELNLDDMLFRYGARINYDLIKDLNCAPIPVLNGGTETSSQQALEPWIYYPLAQPSPGVALVKNIDPVRCQFVSTIDTIPRKGVKKTVLLTSSPYTHVSGAPVYISLNDIGEAANKDLFKDGKKAVAVLLEGKFRSVFLNRTIEGSDQSMPFKSASAAGSAIIVLSDGDIFLNQVNALEKSIYPLGFDKYTRQAFGNKQLALNAVDYLATGGRLISLRDKVVKLHPLNKIRVDEEKLNWQLINLLIPIAVVVLTGILFAFIRRRRYGRSALN